MGDRGPSYFSHSPEWVGGILVTAQGPIPFSLFLIWLGLGLGLDPGLVN